MMRHATIDSPFGPLRITADEKGLVSLSFGSEGSSSAGKPEPKFFREAEAALRNFFDKGKPLPRLTLGSRHGTDFQHKVWRAIEKIPFGETRSYGEIAETIGHPRAARAVGTARGANPLPLFVPCHRVLAARGQIGGYGFIGVEVKKKLLRLEGSWD